MYTKNNGWAKKRKEIVGLNRNSKRKTISVIAKRNNTEKKISSKICKIQLQYHPTRAESDEMAVTYTNKEKREASQREERNEF